jgi:hypothetical protein
VLGRGHGTGVDVHVRVDLDGGDIVAESLEQQAGGRGCLKGKERAGGTRTEKSSSARAREGAKARR